MLDRQFDTGIQVILAYCAFYGKEYVYKQIDKSFYDVFHKEDANVKRRRLRLLRRIDCLNDFKNDNSHLLGAASINLNGKSVLVLK